MKQVTEQAMVYLDNTIDDFKNNIVLYQIAMENCYLLYLFWHKLKLDRYVLLDKILVILRIHLNCMLIIKMLTLACRKLHLFNNLLLGLIWKDWKIKLSTHINFQECINWSYILREMLKKLVYHTFKSKVRVLISKDRLFKLYMSWSRMLRKMIFRIWLKIVSRWVENHDYSFKFIIKLVLFIYLNQIMYSEGQAEIFFG